MVLVAVEKKQEAKGAKTSIGKEETFPHEFKFKKFSLCEKHLLVDTSPRNFK